MSIRVSVYLLMCRNHLVNCSMQNMQGPLVCVCSTAAQQPIRSQKRGWLTNQRPGEKMQQTDNCKPMSRSVTNGTDIYSSPKCILIIAPGLWLVSRHTCWPLIGFLLAIDHSQSAPTHLIVRSENIHYLCFQIEQRHKAIDTVVSTQPAFILWASIEHIQKHGNRLYGKSMIYLIFVFLFLLCDHCNRRWKASALLFLLFVRQNIK